MFVALIAEYFLKMEFKTLVTTIKSIIRIQVPQSIDYKHTVRACGPAGTVLLKPGSHPQEILFQEVYQER